MDEKTPEQENNKLPSNILHGGQAAEQFVERHSLSQEAFNKIKEKFKKDKDFVSPSGEQKAAERDYVLDMLIEQLSEVKNG